LSWLDGETVNEAAALALWNGGGAVRLLDADQAAGAKITRSARRSSTGSRSPASHNTLTRVSAQAGFRREAPAASRLG